MDARHIRNAERPDHVGSSQHEMLKPVVYSDDVEAGLDRPDRGSAQGAVDPRCRPAADQYPEPMIRHFRDGAPLGVVVIPMYRDCQSTFYLSEPGTAVCPLRMTVVPALIGGRTPR